MEGLIPHVIEMCGYVLMDFDNCVHENIISDGYTSSGHTKYSCFFCGQYFSPESRNVFDVRVSIGKMLLVPGIRYSDIMARLGVGQRTIYQVVKIIKKKRLPRCPCGKPPLHFGVCSHKRSKSEVLV